MKEVHLVYFPKWDIIVIAKESKEPFWYRLENSEILGLTKMPLFYTKQKYPSQVILLDSWFEDSSGYAAHDYDMNCDCFSCRSQYSHDWHGDGWK